MSVINKKVSKTVTFTLGDMIFEYDERKNEYKSVPLGETVIGNIGSFMGEGNDIIFVVYTERVKIGEDEEKTDVTRLISARFATSFERGLYYGKY